jgi:hypothetical protein
LSNYEDVREDLNELKDQVKDLAEKVDGILLEKQISVAVQESARIKQKHDQDTNLTTYLWDGVKIMGKLLFVSLLLNIGVKIDEVKIFIKSLF